MDELQVQIEVKDGINVVSSRVIAEQLGKEHSKVKRTLKSLIEQTPNVASDIFIGQYNDRGRMLEEYLLTKDGFTLYMFNIQGYNEFKMAYINKFNEMEKQLIEIKNENGELLVSARELHKGLEITERFSSWFNRMLKYGFEENMDYIGCKVFNTLAKQELQDYILKIDCAKEICMIQRNEKGREFRKYFIECEKRLKEQQIQLSERDKIAILLMNGGIDAIEGAKRLVELATKPLIETIETQEPKVEYHDNVLNSDKLITTTSIAKDLGMSARTLNKELHEKKIIYKSSGIWVLYAKYEHMIPEYCDYVINEYGQSLKWTELGRKFIIDSLKVNN